MISAEMLFGVVLCLLCVLSVGNGADEWVTGLALSSVLWFRVKARGDENRSIQQPGFAYQKRRLEVFDVKGGRLVLWQANGRMASRFFREEVRG